MCQFLVVPPRFTPLTTTNSLAVEDRITGTLLVKPVNTKNVLINVEVYSLPCPAVQWQHNGQNISMDSALFTFDEPCKANELPPYQFHFTIHQLGLVSSGNYSALFSNSKTPIRRLPNLYVTIPGEISFSLNYYWSY